MNAMLRAIGGGAVLALAGILLSAHARAEEAAAQSPEALAKAFAEAGKPGPEHAKLEPLVGSWTYTCRLWMDPSQPATETQGTIERAWILGGRFLEEKIAGTGFDGKPGFEARGLVGYDKGQKKYTSNWVSSLCTSSCTGVGTADASGTFTFQTEAFCPLRNKVVKGREVLRFEGDDKAVAESYQIVDGKEIKMMELVSIRKK